MLVYTMLQIVVRRIAPEGTTRRNLFRLIKRMALALHQRGLIETLRRFWMSVRSRGLRETLRAPRGPEMARWGTWIDSLPTNRSDLKEPNAGLNILGHFRHISGLQVSVCSIVESLRRLGIPTALHNVPTEMGADQPGMESNLGQEIFDVTLIHVQPEPCWETAYSRAGVAPAGNRHRIGMWYWEFGEVPPGWKRLAEPLQELWAPTRFIAHALEKKISVPVYSMLPGVELGPVKVVERERFGLPNHKFLFLFMYDMASIQERKNPLGLIAAFRKAFRHDDRAVLAIKVSRSQNNPAEFAKLNAAAKKAGVIVIDQTLPREDVYGLINACDCYVSLHRSEGLGLTMAEAMLMGKPVIATNYSGNVDFMTPNDSMLVGYKLVPLKTDIPPYKKGLLWAEPSISEAADWMRWAYEHPDDACALGLKGKSAAERVLSVEAAGERLVSRLNTIWGRPSTAQKAA